jgi:hypothetical protein
LNHVPQEETDRLVETAEEIMYIHGEGNEMKSVADELEERGLKKGLERGKADVLVRLIRRRFGLTEEEEAIVRECHDAERLDEAAEACVDPEAGKDEILALLM